MFLGNAHFVFIFLDSKLFLTFFLPFETVFFGPVHVLGFYVATGSCSSCSTSHPAPCLWPRKAAEDGPKPWDPAPSGETQKKLLASGFGSAQLRLLRTLGE